MQKNVQYEKKFFFFGVEILNKRKKLQKYTKKYKTQ